MKNNEEVTPEELEAWLRSTNVLEEDSRAQLAPEATQRPKRRDFKRKCSLDFIPTDGKIFGLDAKTVLRAANLSASSSPSSSTTPSPTTLKMDLKPSSSEISSPLPSTLRSFDCSYRHPNVDDEMVTDISLPHRPLTCAPLGASPSLTGYPDLVAFAKRARKDSSNTKGTQTSLKANDDYHPTSSSPSDAAERGGAGMQQLRRFSLDFMAKWQKLRQQGPRPTSSLPNGNSSSPRSFYRSMDEQSSQFYRMMSNSSSGNNSNAVDVHYNEVAAVDSSDSTKMAIDSSDSTKMSSISNYYDELQNAMEQTQRSRRMIMDAISDGDNDDVASKSADVATEYQMMMEETYGRQQCGVIGMDGPPPPPPSTSHYSTSMDTTMITSAQRKKAAEEEEEARRDLERILREQMILEKRLTELQRAMGGSR
jgi:hypothetical protein